MFRVGIAIVVLAVLWRAIVVNVALYDEGGRPRLPDVRQGIAQDPGADRQLLESMLRENPANAGAYLMLAQDAGSKGDSDRASRAYAAAYSVAPIDRDVLAAVAADFLRAGRVAEALPLLATAVASFTAVRQAAFPIMLDSLASGREPDAWQAIVEANPAWLGDFVVSSCHRGVDPLVIVPLYLR